MHASHMFPCIFSQQHMNECAYVYSANKIWQMNKVQEAKFAQDNDHTREFW